MQSKPCRLYRLPHHARHGRQWTTNEFLLRFVACPEPQSSRGSGTLLPHYADHRSRQEAGSSASVSQLSRCRRETSDRNHHLLPATGEAFRTHTLSRQTKHPVLSPLHRLPPATGTFEPFRG